LINEFGCQSENNTLLKHVTQTSFDGVSVLIAQSTSNCNRLTTIAVNLSFRIYRPTRQLPKRTKDPEKNLIHGGIEEFRSTDCAIRRRQRHDDAITMAFVLIQLGTRMVEPQGNHWSYFSFVLFVKRLVAFSISRLISGTPIAFAN
jgi:hypothetical protein